VAGVRLEVGRRLQGLERGQQRDVLEDVAGIAGVAGVRVVHQVCGTNSPGTSSRSGSSASTGGSAGAASPRGTMRTMPRRERTISASRFSAPARVVTESESGTR